MPRSLTKKICIAVAVTVSVVIIVPLAALAWIKAQRLRGEYRAYQDVRKGRYIELGYGWPAPWRQDFINLVHQRHPEAQFRAVAGCIVNPSLVEYVHGYNDYMKRASIRHFGHDVFQEAADDARNAYSPQRDVEIQK